MPGDEPFTHRAAADAAETPPAGPARISTPRGSQRKPDTRRWIDLHTHSTASDGAFAPTKLIHLAHARGLSALALTDHDTVAGLAEAAAAARAVGLEFVPGIELAARHARGTMHILGYFVDPAAPALAALLADIIDKRHIRNRRILERLAECGVGLDADALHRASPGSVIGRPHIAHALVRAGAATSFAEAFARYLGRGGRAWVERETSTAEEAIAAIRAAGGVASLAHPSQLGYESHLELETIVRRLRAAGLAAIEVHHPDHSPEQTRIYIELAARLGLAISGGTDFHGIGRAPARGVGFGKVRVPYAWLDALRECRIANCELRIAKKT